jgi:hypothetical protein
MKKYFFILPLLCMLTGVSNAQDSTSSKNKWSFLAELEYMFINIHGYSGLGNLPDYYLYETSGDVMDHWKSGIIFYFEAQNDKWAITSDLFELEQTKEEIKNGLIITSGRLDTRQIHEELAGLYKVLPWLEAGAGIRYNSINIGGELNMKTISGTDTVRINNRLQDWVDPIIVARIKNPGATKWITEFRADIGGFGIGSKLAWQIQANVGYRFSHLFQTTFGYRWLDMNYEKGTGDERFLYDIITFGPSLSFGFNF